MWRRGQVRTAIHFAYERRTAAYRGNEPIHNKLGEDTTLLTVTPTLSVALGERLGASLMLPLLHYRYDILEHQTRAGEPLPEHHETLTGLGDAVLMGQMLVTDPGDPAAAWVAAGFTAPTADEREYAPLRGVDFGEVLTPGTGTWDPVLAHGLSLQEGPRTWSASASTRLTMYENRFGYRAGSVAQVWAGVAHTLADERALGLTLGGRVGYRHQWRARRDGRDVVNTGGDWVSVAPSVGWQLLDSVRLKATVDLPMWRNIYAGSDDIDRPVNGQTDADARWTLSIEYGG